jgi:predicted AlkP superfamily phosphohydrolase/phosphomutase
MKRKILVLGLDCAAPEILLGDERLGTIRRLMSSGCYGALESVIPPITVPAWMCLATSQDPGSLGVYGFRNRSDHTYEGLRIANSRSIDAVTIWDQVAREGGRSVIIGVPPNFPVRKVNGISVGCFLTPDTSKEAFTQPVEESDTIRTLVGSYPVDVHGFRTDNKAWLRDQIFEMSRKQFQVVRHYLQNTEWSYFHFVDIGLDRVHHGFWSHHDPQHVSHDPASPFKDVVRDYYAHLDQEIAQVLELLSDDTIVLLVSDHGARRLDGGFCVNEWLVREGLLKLNRYPDAVTPFNKLDVNWAATTAWSEGGYYARVFLNVKGREPQGVIEPADYEKVRDELKLKLEGTTGPDGKLLGTLVWRPEEVYRSVKNVAPDLIVHFGALGWRSIGGVGYPVIHVQENDTGPDDCNHAQWGAFLLAAEGLPVRGEIEGLHLLDIAPTLLELGGYDTPPTMQGRSLAASATLPAGGETPGEAIIRDRLQGLGYLG